MPKHEVKRPVVLLNKLEELFIESISTRLLRSPKLWDQHTFSQKTIDQLTIYLDDDNCHYINHPYTRTKLYIEYITSLPENVIINDFILIFWYLKLELQLGYQELTKILRYFLQELLISQKNKNEINHLFYKNEIQDLLLSELATILEYKDEVINILSSTSKTLYDNHYQPTEVHLNGILFLAVKQNNIRLANLLLSKKFKINIQLADQKGKTLLFWACYHNQVAIAKTLIIDHRANINIHEKKNYTTPLMLACCNRELELVELLLEYGAIIDDIDVNGQTALFWACKRGEHKIAEKLILNHAKVDLKDFKGQTPLKIACSKNNKLLIELLLEYTKLSSSVKKEYYNLLWKYNKSIYPTYHYDDLIEYNCVKIKNSKARYNTKHKLPIAW